MKSVRRENARHSPGQTVVEVIGQTPDSLVVRVGEACWQVPVDATGIPEPYDTRLWQARQDCSGTAVLDFSSLSSGRD